jgi:hypothetical protein
MEENKTTVEEVTPVQEVTPVLEKITNEELSNIRTARNKSIYMTAVAEKAYAQAHSAELEVQNLMLNLLNKYSLNRTNGEGITEDGTIIRKTGFIKQGE